MVHSFVEPSTTAGKEPKQAKEGWPSDNKWVACATLLLFAGLLVILMLPLFSRQSWLIFVQDDFLYYLKVAQSVAHGHGSTFNGIVPTNGYQPLWLIVLIGLSWLTVNPQFILAFLSLSNFVCAIATFLLARKLLQETSVRPLVSFVLAAWVTLYSVTLFFYGMEVTLTVPLMLAVLCALRNVYWLQKSPTHAFALGLLLSAMCLSRLDTLIFGALILAGILVTPSLRTLLRPKLILGATLGFVPLAAYFLTNHALFQTWLPISGMAKELKFSRFPSLEPWRVFFHPLAAGFTVVLLSALLLLPVIKRHLSAMERVIFAATLLFPFLYYSVLSVISDWTLWGWYMYPIRTALCVSFVLFSRWNPAVRLLNHRFVAALLLLSVFFGLSLIRWTRQQADIYAASIEIQEFARSHPGVYAMGDRAGRVAYLIPNPVIQTEGLMMDLPFLHSLKRQTPLKETLGHYNVRYYVATAYEPFAGCFQASEPAKAGPMSAHMRGEFCQHPEATFLHDGNETIIFDLQAPSSIKR